MVRPRFNPEDFPGKIAIHIKTTEEYDKLAKALDNSGRRWCAGRTYIECNLMSIYNCMYIAFNDGRFDDHQESYKYMGYIILEMSDFYW